MQSCGATKSGIARRALAACLRPWPSRFAALGAGLTARAFGGLAAIGLPDRIGLGRAAPSPVMNGFGALPLPAAICSMRAAGGDRAILVEDVVRLALSRIFVAMLDQQPVGALAAGAVVAHPHQHPAAVQLVAVEGELQVALLEAAFGIARTPSSRGPTACTVPPPYWPSGMVPSKSP